MNLFANLPFSAGTGGCRAGNRADAKLGKSEEIKSKYGILSKKQ